MSRAYIFKHALSDIAVDRIEMAYTPFKIKDGPSDDRVAVDAGGRVKVRADNNGDFLLERHTKEDKKAFDAVHVFMVIRQIITMYDRCLLRLSTGPLRTKIKAVRWQWGESRLRVYPRAGQEKNAYYSRLKKCLKLFYFPSPHNEAKIVYTARSYAVVVHEVGHAILDGILPGYMESWQPQTAALIASFGDITVILGLLAQLDQCEAFILHSKGDLFAKEYFRDVGGMFCERAYGYPVGLWNADNDWRLDQVSYDVLEMSQVFTAAFYDVLAEVFEQRQNSKERDDAQVLWKVGQDMMDALLGALLKGPADNVTFADIANLMVRNERNNDMQLIMRDHFTSRRIIGAQAVDVPKKLADNVTSRLWESCRGGLSTDEHLDLVDAVLEQKRHGVSRTSMGRRKANAS